jgi:hypothetical protein
MFLLMHQYIFSYKFLLSISHPAEHGEAFPLVKAFLGHLFKTFQLLEDLQRPNACLVFTEPSNFPFPVKEKLLRYTFRDLKNELLSS